MEDLSLKTRKILETTKNKTLTKGVQYYNYNELDYKAFGSFEFFKGHETN
jgi:hypothetical protein